MSLLTATWDVWRAKRGGPQVIAARQKKRMAELLPWVRERSPFYREKYAALPGEITDISQLPYVTKPELMNRFDDWCTDRALTREGLEEFVHDPSRIGDMYLGKYLVCTTSGTTGAPGIFVQDQRALDIYGALSAGRTIPAWLSREEFFRLIKMGGKTAAVWATHGHFMGISMAKKQLRDRPSRANRMKIFSVLTPLPELVEALNNYQPAILNGYATIISLLAEEQRAGRLHIRPVLIITASESLAKEEQARIQEAFGAAFGSQYGASEDLAIAFTCKAGKLHINADWSIVEPVDDNYQPTPAGQPSTRVLVTNLINRVQPIIRYELGDRVTVLEEPCPCGQPFPAMQLEGRTDDILRFEGALGQLTPITPLAIWSVAKETPGVERFQLIQTGPKRLTVRLSAKEETTWPLMQTRLQEYLASQGLPDILLERAQEPPTRDPKSGKFRSVFRAPAPLKQ